MDPWGYYIYSVYKQGSINLAFFSERAGAPTAKFLGLKTDDIVTFDITEDSWISLTKEDITRIKELRGYDWFTQSSWQEEFKEMLKQEIKIEQDALVSKSIDFTANEYLPYKIENKLFI